ncbi:hypothetical protein H1Q78_13250 [Cellulosimicrobium cellulans]|uniref:hypothetical protein n=1 Tax=Cellulosimicrobium cellulans TaxID=1710 RepID=UPI001EDC91C8|nr:hypothetical protein [Cellulosimicrobium cellulans]UKJ62709.1 hypothetical protein H1Q78_13250 [Cellulosimicrobium cellulans]
MSPEGTRGAGAPADAGTDADALVDGLFALPLEQFVVARTAAAKEIKASGDAVGAERVARLAKPTVAAWVVNQVARERPDDVAALVGLGDELRDATTDRDRARIRTLDRLRRERVERVVGELRDAGEVAGRAVSATALDRLAETLTAAVMDPDAGALVRAGRLSQALQHVGFGIVDEGGEPADVVELRARTGGTADTGGRGVADADAEKSTTRGGRGARPARASGPADGERPEEDAVAAAEREVEETAAEVDRLEAERDEADTRVRAASDAVGQVEEELGRVEDELARLADEREDLRARLAEARDAAAAAQESLDGVDARLDAAEERAAAARKTRRTARRG